MHAVHAMTTEPIERLFRENPPLVWDLRPVVADYPKPLLLLLAAPGEGINDPEGRRIRSGATAAGGVEMVDSPAPATICTGPISRRLPPRSTPFSAST